MSFECRNNVAPVDKPRAADVWSLGIVLINITTLPVANFLVENVFCILDDPTEDSQRIGAREFGVSPASRRPSSRPPSAAGGSPRRPPALLRAMCQSTPVDPVDHNGPDGTHPPALDLVLSEEDEEEEQQQQAEDGLSPSVRSLSTSKRLKRGRKGKGMTPRTDDTQTSERLAMASQTLVRELNRQTRSTMGSTETFLDVPASQPVAVPRSTAGHSDGGAGSDDDKRAATTTGGKRLRRAGSDGVVGCGDDDEGQGAHWHVTKHLYIPYAMLMAEHWGNAGWSHKRQVNGQSEWIAKVL
ncbi:hypothetical protein EDB86DRAFT_2836367 [Lactarius hatsudake]|nr:hypothetical protein EDB86DRAFT_2836367 [Lactarius hatsudake]